MISYKQWTLIFAVYIHRSVSTSPSWIDTLPSFADPEDRPFHKAVIDKHTGDVFVAGRNVLYHFSPNLTVKQSTTTGPALDHPDCLHPSYPCDHKKSMTNNTNQLLEMVYHLGSPPKLLLCGSLYKGLCEVRPTDVIAQRTWVHPYNRTVGFNTRDVMNHAIFGPGYNGQWSLYAATTASSDTRNSYSAPFLSSKILVKTYNTLMEDLYYFEYSFKNNTARSAMKFKGNSTRIVIDDGFIYDRFVYFMVLHVSETQQQSSRLVRVCTEDGTFNSFAELPIFCNQSGNIFNLALSVHLGVSSTSIGGTQEMLYVAFIKKVGVKVVGTTLCGFSMSSVIQSFTNRTRECINDTVGDYYCHLKGKQQIDDFCGSDITPYVVSQPLVSDYLSFLPQVTVTAITTLQQYDKMIAILGLMNGFVIKIDLQTGGWFTMNDLLDKNTAAEIRSPLLYDLNHEHIYFLVKNKIVKFPIGSCGAHETCSSCLTKGKLVDPLQCGWCNGRCSRQEHCTDPGSFINHTCTPSIFEVTPQKGPLQGGTLITITGDSLGSYIDDDHNSIYVAGTECKIFSWEDNMVKCTIGSTQSEISGPVQLNVINLNDASRDYNIAGSAESHQNFSYYTGPRLFGIFPDKGPTSGGTYVKLFGENLDVGESRAVSIHGRLCTLKGFDKNAAWCITGNESSSVFPDSIALHFDNVMFEIERKPPPTFNVTGLSQTFVYLPDPEIHQIQPGITTVSGLMNVSVSGLRLDIVQSPRMVVKVSLSHTTEKLELEQPCWANPESGGRTLTCRTPSLKSRGVPIPTRTHPLLTHVGFILDAVQVLRDLNEHQEVISRLLYYPDPEFRRFQELKTVSKDQAVLEIKGYHLDLIQSPDNLHVVINDTDLCKITTISIEFVLCDLPPNLISNSSLHGTKLSVEVVVGFSKRLLGFIEVEHPEENASSWGFIGLAVFVFFFLAMIYMFYSHFKSFRRKKSPLRHLENCTLTTRTEVENGYRSVPCNFVTTAPSTARASVTAPSTPNAACADYLSEVPLLDPEIMRTLEDDNLIILKEFLEMGEQIGQGQFGYVFEGFLKPQQKKVAIKTLQKHSWRNPQTVDKFLEEGLLMKNFRHPNVMRLIGVCFNDGLPTIVLPYMKNGDLCSYLRNKDIKLLVTDLLKFALDACSGMAYLAEKKFVHRDLAARNCLLDSSSVVKVADFGLSREVYEDDYYCSGDRKVKLPYKWMAPESIDDNLYSQQSDVWSYGVLLWELLTRGTVPYKLIHNWELLQCIKTGYRLPQPQYCPDDLYTVMLACWIIDYRQRPCFSELQHHISQIREILLRNVQTSDISTCAQNTVYVNWRDSNYLRMDGSSRSDDVLQDS